MGLRDSGRRILTIEFTPDKTGTVDIVGGMSMVKGSLIVVAH
jgi:hypothetical protein